MSGPPWLVVPHRPRGCMEQAADWLRLWAWRLAWAALFFGLGYGCGVVSGE